MSSLFLRIVNMSIAAGWLILVVIALRFLLKKAPKWSICLLWALAAARLVCPFSIESILSLIPSAETVPANIEMMREPAIDSGIGVINEVVNPVVGSFSPDPTFVTSANPLQVLIPILAIVWLAGIAAMLLYALISYWKLKKSVAASVPAGEGVMICDDLPSPFIFGLFRPLIYLPSSMEEQTREYVLAHEQAHLKRRDHLWKPLGFLLLSVYWFNPLCWIAYILLCRDIEAACDEKVIRNMDKEAMAAYSQALLDCSFPRKRITACPLAFGEVGVKERVKGVLNYKKPAFWIILAAVIACIVVAVCFLTNPKKEEPSPFTPRTFTAVVTRIESQLFYVRPDEGMPELLSSDCFEVSLDKLLQAEDVLLEIGDRVEISYNGEILEIYPARLGKVESVRVIRQEVPQARFFETDAIYMVDELLTAGTAERKGQQVLELWPYVYFSQARSDLSGEWRSYWSIAMSYALSGRYVVSGDRVRAMREEGAFVEFRILSEMEIIVEKISDSFYPEGIKAGWLKEGDILTAELYGDQSGAAITEDALRAEFPNYFGLPADKGLEVYVSQFAKGEYYCNLLPADPERTAQERDTEIIYQMGPCSMDVMRKILSAYDVPEEKITVIAYQNPISSYSWPGFDLEADSKRLREMLFN